MFILTFLILLPLLFSSPPPSFQDIIHNLEHFKASFQPQSFDKVLNSSAPDSPVSSSIFSSASSSFLPSHLNMPLNHHPTDQECGRKVNCGGECDGICVVCLLNGELGWKCLKNLKIPNLEEP